MELTKFSPRTDILRVASEKNLIPQMDGKVKEIFMLLADRMIKDCTEVEIMNEVNDGIAKAMLIMGLNVKGETEEAVQEIPVEVPEGQAPPLVRPEALRQPQVRQGFQEGQAGLRQRRPLTHTPAFWTGSSKQVTTNCEDSVPVRYLVPPDVLGDSGGDELLARFPAGRGRLARVLGHRLHGLDLADELVHVAADGARHNLNGHDNTLRIDDEAPALIEPVFCVPHAVAPGYRSAGIGRHGEGHVLDGGRSFFPHPV